MTNPNPTLNALGLTPYQDMPNGPDLVAFRHQQAGYAFQHMITPLYAEAEPDHPEVLAWMDRYLADPATCPTLFLAGDTGAGKTWQAMGALRRIVITLADRGQGLHWRTTNQPRFTDRLRPKADRSHENAIDPYLDLDLLVFDDVGAGKPSEWVAEVLYQLVDHRLNHRKPTIYTSNLDKGTLTAAVGDRIVSRLGLAHRITLTDSDRRWAQ